MFGGSQGATSLNEVMVEAFGETGPRSSTSAASATSSGSARKVRRDDYKLVPFTDEFGAALAAADSSSLGPAARSGACRGGKARDPRPVSVRDGRSPGEERPFFERTGGAITVPETELGRVADLARSLIGDPSA